MVFLAWLACKPAPAVDTAPVVDPRACAYDTAAPTWAPGLTATSTDGALTVAFRASTPTPPVAGNNTWVVDVADGGPLSGATVATKLFMPAMGHGSDATPVSSPTSTPGEYTLSPVSFVMPGIWQVTFTVTAPGVDDAAALDLCVDAT